MNVDDTTDTDDLQIRRLIEDRVQAVRGKRVDDATSSHAPDVLMFDVVTPLAYVGSDAVRRRTAEWFSSFDGPIGYEVRDLRVAARGDVAFCHYLYRVSGTQKRAGEIDMWVRATVCLRRVDGRWLIAHEHNSAPFDPESGKAALDSRPG
jgi:uncharacterized protein (TIGR02246 family)